MSDPFTNLARGESGDGIDPISSISLRRHQQFAVITAASAKRVQLGLQLPGEPVTERLVAGDSMCSHRVNLASTTDVDAAVLGWLRRAYDRN